MSSQPGIHDKTFSQLPDERIKAARQLGALFEAFPDRRQAFEDLLRLCSDMDSEVREEAINSLKTVFPNVPEKELVWERFENLTAYPVEQVLKAAVDALITVFPLMPDKNRAWKDLIDLANSKSSLEDVGRGIISSLPNVISEFLDKGQAWKDLLEMTASDDPYIREKAISFLSMVFPELPEEKKGEAWEGLLELAGEAVDIHVREQAAKIPGKVFPFLPDDKKDDGWEEMLNLAGKTVDQVVQKEILISLPSVFSSVPDKKRAWSNIFMLTEDDREPVRKQAVDILVSIFPDMSDKNRAWSDFLKLTGARDRYVKDTSADALVSVFPYLEDKNTAWKELIGLTENEDEYIRKTAADALSKVFPYMSYKNQAYSDLENLDEKYEQDKEKGIKKPAFDFLRPTGEKDKYVRKDAAEPFSRVYSGRPDKEIVEELLRLSSDPDPQMRRGAIESLLVLYSRKSGKEQDIWRELLKVSGDADTGFRKDAAGLLSHVFPAVEEKPDVFFDLVRLTESQDTKLRKKAAELLASAFTYTDNKQSAWDDLLRLTSAEDREVRKGAVLALSSGYSEVPDKEKVWSDLIRLSAHSDSFVQRVATRSLGPAFFYVPDKTQAWRDLQVLIDNPYIYVRRYALQSLGRASLWRAFRAENEATYLFGLKEAVKYFKQGAETSIGTGIIPEFYYPFYEALLQVLFAERSSRLESERYLSEVTHGIMDLEENQRLLQILEEFTGLLRAAGELAPGDLPARKKLLEACIEAFDRSSGFFGAVEEDAILAQKTLKKEYPKSGKVIQEQKLKDVLSGIRYKARTACLQAKGKPTEKMACIVSQKVREWTFQDLERDRKKLDRQLESLLDILIIQIPYVPENTFIFENLENIRQEQDLLERYRRVGRLISLIPRVRMSSRA